MSHVADVAVLIKSQNIALDGAQIKSTLLSSVDKKTNQDGRVLTGGWLNAARHRTVSDGVAGQLPAGSRVRPVFGSTVREMTPTVAATVRDRRTNLAKGGDRRYVDGSQENTSSYSSATDRLHYRSSRLYDDRRAVRIVAPEASGNRVDECWNVVIRSGWAARGTTGTDGDLSRPFLMPSERASYGVRDEGDRGGVW